MGKVRLLPPEIISKIAAGEVIERPASVVKELVENSLDAQASAVEVTLKDAGKKEIIVKDNGSGIDSDDLEKIFLRHSTSKITNLDDLFAIRSFGFRGEALYSIAAISDVLVTSKTNSQYEAMEIHLRGAQRINFRPAALSSNGTEIQIKELFFNTPARRKFLKSNTAEVQQVLNVFIPYALLYHRVRFLLRHQDRTLLDLPANDSHLSRIAETLNLDEKFIKETAQNFPDKNISLRIFLGDINIKRARRDLQYIFVNNRPVFNKNISFHLNQAFRLIMPEDSFGFFVAFINLPPEDIDANVHPTKREVKIKDEQMLCYHLKQIAETTLMQTGGVKQVSAVDEAQAFRQKPLFLGPKSDETLAPDSKEESLFASDSAAPKHQSGFEAARRGEIQDFFIPRDSQIFTKDSTLQKRFENSRYVGQFMNKYLLFEAGNSLLVMDQHAAAERIAYETILRQIEKGSLEVQRLLSPVLVRLTPTELLLWEELQPTLEKFGFENNQWDPETVAVHSHPQIINDVEKAVRNILSGEVAGKSANDEIARRACHASIKTGDFVHEVQAAKEKNDLLKCLDPFTCPHGRPIVVEINEAFLDKQFLRS